MHNYVHDEETNSVSPDMKEKFREHRKRRKESRAEKDGYKKKKKKEKKKKKKAKADGNFHVATFDMQAVLQTPCSAAA